MLNSHKKNFCQKNKAFFDVFYLFLCVLEEETNGFKNFFKNTMKHVIWYIRKKKKREEGFSFG